jgi:putative oxidoreductase
VPLLSTGLELDAKSVISVVCGLFLLPHTIAKLSNVERASQLFDKVGLRPAPVFVVLTALLELVAAFGLISGLYPRIGASIAAAILLVAAYAVSQVHGLKWRWQHPGIEYMLFWATVCLCATLLP